MIRRLLSSRCCLAAAFFSLFCSLSVAQEAKVRTSFATNTTIWVGQKTTLVVELLAPGFFASAPSFDLPDPQGLLLMAPTSRPVLSSEESGGVSYTVQRHELSVFAQRAGEQVIPSFNVRFSFKHAPLDTNSIPASVKTSPVQFIATLPPGAEKLGTLISARNLKVTEAWIPEPGKTNVKAGSAFTRTITFTAPDVPSMAFPPFPTGAIDGIGIYSKPPEVLDKSERSALSGERRDTITYVCERPGKFLIPPARFTWWDLDAQKLRTIDFPAYTLTVVANPALVIATTSRTSETPAPKWLWRTILGLISVVAISWLAWRMGAWTARCRAAQCFQPMHLQPLNPRPNSEVRRPDRAAKQS